MLEPNELILLGGLFENDDCFCITPLRTNGHIVDPWAESMSTLRVCVYLIRRECSASMTGSAEGTIFGLNPGRR